MPERCPHVPDAGRDQRHLRGDAGLPECEMIDEAGRMFGRKTLAERGRLRHKIIVMVPLERLEIENLTDFSHSRSGKDKQGAQFLVSPRTTVTQPKPPRDRSAMLP